MIVTGLGSFATYRYVRAADGLNIEAELTERMAAVRRQVAAGDLALAAAQPFVQVLVGAAERVASPNAEGVKIDRTWVDDGKLHELKAGEETYVVLVRGASFDGLIATVTVGRNKADATRGSAALMRSLILLSLLAGGVAAAATGLLAARGEGPADGTSVVSGGSRTAMGTSGERGRVGRRRNTGPASADEDLHFDDRDTDVDTGTVDGHQSGGFGPPRAGGPLVRRGPTPKPPPPPLFPDVD